MSDGKESEARCWVVPQSSDSNEFTRRSVLAAGALIGAAGALGVSTAALARARRPARSAILIFLHGGPSHLDLWDPKAQLPESMRSPFAAIPTQVSGLSYTELLPRLAGSNDLFTTIRSMHSCPPGLFFHDAAVHQMLCGQTAQTADYTGRILGGSLDASLQAPDGVLASLTQLSTAAGDVAVKQIFQQSDTARLNVLHRARRLYGENLFGAALLQALRRVESGQRLVHVHWHARSTNDPYSWDVHDRLTANMRDYSAPVLDRGLSALFRDLHRRGLLEEVVVAVMGEFGRSPLKGVSTSGRWTGIDGRDHWPHCYSALIGGGGIRGGLAYGCSDETGAHPATDPVTPADLLMTIRYALEPPVATSVARDRPKQTAGRVLTELFEISEG